MEPCNATEVGQEVVLHGSEIYGVSYMVLNIKGLMGTFNMSLNGRITKKILVNAYNQNC